MANKDDPSGYFEGFLGERRPNYQGYTDDELSDAIARAAIAKGHDPAKEGVAVSAKVMEEDDSESIAYKRQVEARLLKKLSKTFGLSQDETRTILLAQGALTPEPEEEALDVLADPDAIAIPDEDAGPILTQEYVAAAQLQVYSDFIRQVRMYDKWLRPLIIFCGVLWFSSATVLTPATTVVLLFTALLAGTYKPSTTKALKAESRS